MQTVTHMHTHAHAHTHTHTQTVTQQNVCVCGGGGGVRERSCFGHTNSKRCLLQKCCGMLNFWFWLVRKCLRILGNNVSKTNNLSANNINIILGSKRGGWKKQKREGGKPGWWLEGREACTWRTSKVCVCVTEHTHTHTTHAGTHTHTQHTHTISLGKESVKRCYKKVLDALQGIFIGRTLWVGLARTIYMHRIQPHSWWFPCQKCLICTVFTYGSGQL